MLIVLAVAIPLITQKPPTNNSQPTVEEFTPEQVHNLAVGLAHIESNSSNPTEESIKNINDALVALKPKCPKESYRDIASDVSFAFDVYKKHGSYKSMANIINDTKKNMPVSNNYSCGEWITASTQTELRIHN